MTHKIPLYLATLSIVALAGILATPVSADENLPLLNKDLFSIGGGISSNSASGDDDEIGFQIFGAYDMNQINLMEGVASSIEFGYMDYGFSNDSTGIWSTWVVSGAIQEGWGWLARAGYDFGDDNGLMIGGGASYIMNDKMQLRGEYVVRDDVDSLQFNILYHL
jgi:hypothetical protein